MKKHHALKALLWSFFILSQSATAQKTVGIDQGKKGPHSISVVVEDRSDKSPLIVPPPLGES